MRPIPSVLFCAMTAMTVVVPVVAQEAASAPPALVAGLPTASVKDVDAVVARFRAYYVSGRFHSVPQDVHQWIEREQIPTATDEGSGKDRILEQGRAILRLQAADGTWPDINYADENRTFWRPLLHTGRVVVLTMASGQPGIDEAERKALKAGADRAISLWRVRDFRSSNWWYNDFGVPLTLGAAGLLLGDALSDENRAYLVKRIRKDGGRKEGYLEVGGGANQVWFFSVSMLGSLLARDPTWTGISARAFWLQLESPITVAPERRAAGVNVREGLQPDATLHQHRAQMQTGNYGLAFAIDLAAWAWILQGSPFAMPAERLPDLRRYLLDMQAWAYWRGRIEVNSVGRRFSPGVMVTKFQKALQPFTDLSEIDPSTAATSLAFATRNRPGATNDLLGYRWFWRSDYGVSRNEAFFATVRLHSNHAEATESCNGENLQGQHMGDGVTCLSTRGGEYDDIFPVWDWMRVPGITNVSSPALQAQLTSGTVPAMPEVSAPAASPIQAGGAGSGRQGCIAYQHPRSSPLISARKSWFFDRNIMVCLGSGIIGKGDQSVVTSVNQCLGRGPVQVCSGGTTSELEAGTLRPLAAEWIQHDGLRYEFPTGGSLLAGVATQTGEWKSVSVAVTTPAEPQSLPVFSLVIDHGRKPSAATYAYAVRPVDAPATTYRIVANTPEQQAVAWDERRISIVFWSPGKLAWGNGRSIAASTPCLVNLDGERISVSDPTWTLSQMELSLDGRAYPVSLRKDVGYAGSTTSLEAR